MRKLGKFVGNLAYIATVLLIVCLVLLAFNGNPSFNEMSLGDKKILGYLFWSAFGLHVVAWALKNADQEESKSREDEKSKP